MNEEFVLDDDLFSSKAKVQPIDLPETEDESSEETVNNSTGLGEFNFNNPPQSKENSPPER